MLLGEQSPRSGVSVCDLGAGVKTIEAAGVIASETQATLTWVWKPRTRSPLVAPSSSGKGGKHCQKIRIWICTEGNLTPSALFDSINLRKPQGDFRTQVKCSCFWKQRRESAQLCERQPAGLTPSLSAWNRQRQDKRLQVHSCYLLKGKCGELWSAEGNP